MSYETVSLRVSFFFFLTLSLTPPPSLQGIYRVNGVKTRVEKLCQAFENGKELVELSQCSPHDISNVLKLYLRQVSRHMCEFV